MPITRKGMNAKTTTVTLAVGNVTQDFEFTHAERLLRMTKAGWHIPDNSKYEFVNNAIRIKQDKQGNNRGTKRASVDNGDIAPTKA